MRLFKFQIAEVGIFVRGYARKKLDKPCLDLYMKLNAFMLPNSMQSWPVRVNWVNRPNVLVVVPLYQDLDANLNRVLVYLEVQRQGEMVKS